MLEVVFNVFIALPGLRMPGVTELASDRSRYEQVFTDYICANAGLYYK
jgi:hypothetical protein